jgi:uncharacterized protein (TIGR02588 family)
MPGYYSIPVTVTNMGHATAEQVHVEVTLKKIGGDLERAEFEIMHLPKGATRHGTIHFESDPRQAASTTPRVLGYQRP